MAKIDFSKAEKSFDSIAEKRLINRLAELASPSEAIQDPSLSITGKTVEGIILRFQKQLKQLKKADPTLYDRLQFSEEDEKKIFQPVASYSQIDWIRLRDSKLKIEELKLELYGKESIEAENEKQVSSQRKKHINKRFNVRDDWLPLK